MKHIAGKLLITLGIILMIFIPSSQQDAVRDLPACVEEGEEFTITVETGNYPYFAEINESICSGWSYVNSSLNSAQVTVSGNYVKFTLIGYVPSFNYTLRAPTEEGCCIITGTMKAPYTDPTILQPNTICICNSTITPTPSPSPTATVTTTSTSPTPPTTSTSGSSGGGGGFSPNSDLTTTLNPEKNDETGSTQNTTKTSLKNPIIRRTSSDGQNINSSNTEDGKNGIKQNDSLNTDSIDEKDSSNKKRSPGFEFLFAVLGLVTIYLILRKG